MIKKGNSVKGQENRKHNQTISTNIGIFPNMAELHLSRL